MLPNSDLPTDVDWAHWVVRWDRMQDRYLARRDERFALMVGIVSATQDAPTGLLDLGCGTGSLMVPLLEAFPEAQVYGLDLDPTLLLLARERLAPYGERARLVHADLRAPSWPAELPLPLDAVVSATALHWLPPPQLAALYGRIAGALRLGGVFLNADHAASAHQPLQRAWERQRTQALGRQSAATADDWDGFWAAYGEALRVDIRHLHEQFIGLWEGVDEGMPLAWHLHQLRNGGFAAVDCFWRCDCDAIYGGFRLQPAREELPAPGAP